MSKGICPIFRINPTIVLPDEIDCVGEACQWWVDGRCAVATIAISLNLLAEKEAHPDMDIVV